MFSFDSSDLSELKKENNASRVINVMGLIWKSLISASKKTNGFQKTSVLSISVNLRTKASPPLKDFSMGNIIWFATARFEPENELGLSSIIACLQDSIAEIDAHFVEGLKGDEGSAKMVERLRKLQEEVYSDEDNAEYYCVSSWCNLGFLEVDFGFGKPSRILHGCPDSENPGVANMILLNDSGCGDGIEALVSVCEDYMMIIEEDDELLRFASNNNLST
ncbi:hypothetical protein LIER_21809 [Lithospermum erythrorhizon]|uniref:Uncharacterized protein n=1 Tax=Lithospermum erythrorhizon TaxID=34254 RepID=A0AAV3QUN5_LITER